MVYMHTHQLIIFMEFYILQILRHTTLLTILSTLSFIIDTYICAYAFMCSCMFVHVFYICDICTHFMCADFTLLFYLWVLGQR